MKKIFLPLLACFSLLASCTSQPSVTVLTPKAFVEATQSDSLARILDVRRPDEYAQGHIEGAINIDWLNKESFTAETEKLNREYTYYIYCRSGRRSNAAASQLKANGFKVIDLEGGILHWQKQGMPVVK